MWLHNLVTVVIPCKNEGALIKKTLRLLGNQMYAHGMKVIVADSSDDEITRMMIDSEKNGPLDITVVQGGLPAVARNNGASHVRTPYVLFLDADIFLEDQHTLYTIVANVAYHDLELATCRISTHDAYRAAFWAFDLVRGLIIKKTPFAVGGFMLFNTRAFNRVGKFNQKALVAEDYHISKKIDPKLFKIFDRKVFTTSRRFKKKGLLYFAKMLLLFWFNRDNEEFYTRDFKYFE